MSETQDREKAPVADSEDANAWGRNEDLKDVPEMAPSNGQTSLGPRDGDVFLGAEVCQMPVQNERAATPPGYISLAAVQERTAAAALTLNGVENFAQEVPLDLPFSQITHEGSTSDRTAWMEGGPWRREDGTALPALAPGGYVYNRPVGRLPGRFATQPPSVAGSGTGLKVGVLPHQLQSGRGLDAGRSVPNAPGSICTSHATAAQRGMIGRREEIYRLSQNPWGPNTVFGPQSIATDVESWQFRNGERSFDPGCLLHSDGTFPHDLLRTEGQPFSMYSKYQGRNGVFRRVRRKIVEVGGRLCQSFFVWVLLVAALAGMEGFREKSDSMTMKDHKPDMEWSDSEADSENDPQQQQAKFNVFSFKG